MEKILDILGDYILILDKDGNIEFCNKKLLLKLQYSRNELKNINISKILCEDGKDLNTIINNTNTIDDSIKIDIAFLKKNKEKLFVFSEIVVDYFKGKESIIIVSKDICEKTYTREHLENILDTMPFSCWIKGLNGEYLYVNESYAKELNDDRLNILGNKQEDYWNEEMCNFFTHMDKEVIESKKYQLIEDHSEHEGTELWVEIFKAPIMNKENEVEYIFGFTKDITLQKKVATEMDNNNKEINNLNSILMKTNTKDNVSELLSNIGENILNYFESDGISILLVNKESDCLDVGLRLGTPNELEKFSWNTILNKYQGIKNYNEVDNKILREYMAKNKVHNIGVYNIEFNDEIIGFLVLTYLENNIPKFKKSDYLKTISGNLATMIKSHTLSKEVKDEFEKRTNIEKELELFLDISVDLIARLKINGEIKTISNNWSETLGWSEDELLSMNILDIIHPDYKGEIIDILRCLKEDAGYVINRVLCKDGNYKWIEWNYKILREEGSFVITAKDISQQKKQEEEKKILEETIQMESLRNEFFANISHEFRTPLNIILGTMQLMQRNVEKNQVNCEVSLNLRNHIKYIKQNSYRLLRLVNNLIDITSIDTGYYKLQLGNYNIIEIVENITLSVAQYVEDHGINLVFDTNCEEKIIACDPDKIERIVLNILSNAIKYTDRNGEIYVNLHVDNNKIKVSIKDNGVGMSHDKLDIIFDRFKKIDNNLNRKCEGSGIGLSLVKSLVELHEGNIYVKSELGKGSEFIFELPIRTVGDEGPTILDNNISTSTQIEKCNIEFSDIYS